MLYRGPDCPANGGVRRNRPTMRGFVFLKQKRCIQHFGRDAWHVNWAGRIAANFVFAGFSFKRTLRSLTGT